MKKINYLVLLFGISATLFMACGNELEPSLSAGTYDHGVLIINEGNFFSGDGEITHYDPMTEEVTNNLYQKVNGVVLAAYIEQVRVFGDKAYIVDSNQGGAKVVAVDKASFVEKGRVEGLEIPRDVAVAGNRLFIADWGNYDDQGNYTNPNSFVAVADINGGEVLEKITVSSRPQSIVEFNGNIYVACQESMEIIKINPSSLEIVARATYSAIPSEFLLNKEKLFLYSTMDQQIHLDEINPEALSASGTIYDIPNTSRLILNETEEALVLTSEFSEDFSYTENQVLSFPLSGAGSITTIYEARSLKGIGLDKPDNQLYIADDNGIQGNGTVIITDQNGEEIKKLDVGRVPSKFHFY
ncbi:MAG: DUF5074 domain-containing protein [Anditalea sp.]